MNRTTSRSSIKLTDTQYKYCQKITNKISKLSIAEIFLYPVDLNVCSDYLTYVKKPMDLGKVSEKLETHQYSTLNDWRNDMNLIWKNALAYNPQSSVAYLMAEELQKKFKELTETVPLSKDEEWVFKLKKIHNKFQRILQSRPSSSQKDT